LMLKTRPLGQHFSNTGNKSPEKGRAILVGREQ
jgi:hypothetical protein